MGPLFRLALAQAPAGLDAPQDRIDWLAAEMPAVRDMRADLVLLPELFATGYNIGSLHAARAEPSDGPLARRIAGLARQYGVAIHYGYAERDGLKVYSAAQCFGPDGAALGAHRKLLIPPGFERDHLSPGHGIHLFTLGPARIATLICYDVEFPETVRHVALAGADIVLAPTALSAEWPAVAYRMMPTRAFENGLFLAYANSAGTENGLKFLGASVIVAPDGQELARAGEEPELLFAELDLGRVGRARSRLPYLDEAGRLALG